MRKEKNASIDVIDSLMISVASDDPIDTTVKARGQNEDISEAIRTHLPGRGQVLATWGHCGLGQQWCVM